MRKLNIAGASIVTGTDLAAAVMELALELARSGTTEVAEIPYNDVEGRPQRAWLMIGLGISIWMSSIDPDDGQDELDGLDDLLSLRERVADVRGRRQALNGRPL